MKVFTCIDHRGHWAVPTASVVVARDEEEAHELLKLELKGHGIDDDDFTLQELATNKPFVRVLSDGEY